MFPGLLFRGRSASSNGARPAGKRQPGPGQDRGQASRFRGEGSCGREGSASVPRRSSSTAFRARVSASRWWRRRHVARSAACQQARSAAKARARLSPTGLVQIQPMAPRVMKPDPAHQRAGRIRQTMIGRWRAGTGSWPVTGTNRICRPACYCSGKSFQHRNGS